MGILIFSILCVLYATAFGETSLLVCPFFNNRVPSPQPNLRNCTLFQQNSCCVQHELDAIFSNLITLQQVSPVCEEYLNHLMCFVCDPNQTRYYANGHIRVCEDYCDRMYLACGNAIINNRRVEDAYTTGRDFCLRRRYLIGSENCFTGDPQIITSGSTVLHTTTLLLSYLIILILSVFIFDFQSLQTEIMSKNSKYKLILSVVLLFNVMSCNSVSQGTLTDTEIKQWSEILSNHLTQVSVDGLGYEDLQATFDDSAHSAEYMSARNQISEIKTELSIFLYERQRLVNQLALEIQSLFDSENLTDSTEYSSIDMLPPDVYLDADFISNELNCTFSSRFNTRVCMEQSGVKLPSNSNRLNKQIIDTVRRTSRLDEIFMRNSAEVPTVLWQYFGSSDGVLRSYPAREWGRNLLGFSQDFDPRTRPWYLSVTSSPKDVVIILDVSSSMQTNERLVRLKATVKSLLLTLTKLDRVNIILSRSSYWTTSGDYAERHAQVLSCTEDVLVAATQSNVQQLLAMIHDLEADGGSEHTEAFSKAFTILKKSQRAQSSSCLSVVVMITDGLASEPVTNRCSKGYHRYLTDSSREFVPGKLCWYNHDDLAETVSGLQNKLDHPAHIFSFLVETDEKDPDSRMDSIACQNQGMPIKIQPDSDTLVQIRPYFELLKTTSGEMTSQWTSPYLDESGLGLMITVSASVYSQTTGRHLGVVGLDVPLEEVEDILQRASWGQVYAFLVDSNDLTAVVHPFVKPALELTTDPIFVPVWDLETYKGEPQLFQTVLDQIQSGRSDVVTMSTNARRVVTRQESLSWQPVSKVTYGFAPINDTGLSVVLNIGPNDDRLVHMRPAHGTNLQTTFLHTMQKYRELSDELPGVFEQLNPTRNVSRYHGVEISEAHSVLQLAPRAFCDPGRHQHLYSSNLSAFVVETHTYLNNATAQFELGCPDGVFAPGVRADAQMTSTLETTWLSRDENLHRDVVWSYVGTRNGVMRIYPGVRMAAEYDPTSRDWYKRTLANDVSALTLSNIYRDSIPGIGHVVSLSKAILTPSTTHMIMTPAGVNGECGLDMFSCNNGYCIEARLVCDGHAHCSNSRDENQPECPLGDYIVRQFNASSISERELCVELSGIDDYLNSIPENANITAQIWTRSSCAEWWRSEAFSFNSSRQTQCVTRPILESFSFTVVIFVNGHQGGIHEPSLVNGDRFEGGCPCWTGSQCSSGVCNEHICRGNSIHGVVAMDMRYADFRERVMGLGSEFNLQQYCGATYNCHHGGLPCRTKCYIVTDTAHLAFDEDFMTSSQDMTSYKEDISDVTLATRQGYVFSELLKRGVFVKHFRKDYQSVCYITQPVKVSGVNGSSSETLQQPPGYSQSSRETFDLDESVPNIPGPFPPFKNHYSCVREVLHYEANRSAFSSNNPVIQGSLDYDPCAHGRFHFTPVPGMNVYLLVLEDYRPVREPNNFNCQISNSVNAPGSFELQTDMCSEALEEGTYSRRQCPLSGASVSPQLQTTCNFGGKSNSVSNAIILCSMVIGCIAKYL